MSAGNASPQPHRGRRIIDLFEARPRLRWLVAALFAAVVALVSATQLYVSWRAAGAPASAGPMLAGELVEWLSWVAILAGILAVDRRFGFGRPGIGVARAVAVHAVCAVSAFALQNGIMVWIRDWMEGGAIAADGGLGSEYLSRFLFRGPSALLIYALLLGAVWVLRLIRAYDRQRLERERLSAQLAHARFENLSAQMRPHFLFNTLHTVASLVRDGDRERAIETLAGLGDLLRRSIDLADEQEVPLEDELAFLDGYIRIQLARFGDRLRIERAIEPEILSRPVPALILQPLVENAIRHGLELERKPGEVRVEGFRSGRSIVLEVADNGTGLEPGANGSGGIGLRNTRERLSQLYGTAARLEIEGGAGGGTIARLTLPDAAAVRDRAAEGSGG